MQTHYSTEQTLESESKTLVDFDVQSLLQMASAEGRDEPELWLVNPEGYQEDGHPLRDSKSTRLIAYSIKNDIVYATDGCNACRHVLNQSLDTCQSEELVSISQRTQLPLRMLEQMGELVKNKT